MDPVTLISQVGFPIAAFVLMWRLARGTMQDMADAFDEQAREFERLRNEVSES